MNMSDAYREALRKHIAAIDGRRPQDGHSEDGFSTCPHPICRAVHAAPLPPEFGDIFGGQFYGVTTRGRLLSVGTAAPEGREADYWICRRVVDYAPAPVPPGGAITPCTKCGASVVFNPKREGVTAPKICMQCARIKPLPIES